MIHYAFIGLSWLVGSLGVGGAIAAVVATVFLGPSVVLPILEAWALAFFRCTRCVAAAVFVLATLGAYWVGHHEAVAECRADALAAELRVKKIDLENAEKAKTDETKRAATVEAFSNDRHAKDLDYIATLEAKPGCGFDPGPGDSGGVRFGASRFRFAKPAAGAK